MADPNHVKVVKVEAKILKYLWLRCCVIWLYMVLVIWCLLPSYDLFTSCVGFSCKKHTAQCAQQDWRHRFTCYSCYSAVIYYGTLVIFYYPGTGDICCERSFHEFPAFVDVRNLHTSDNTPPGVTQAL